MPAYETPEILLASWGDDAGVGGIQQNATTSASLWYAQSLKPVFPADREVTSWGMTKVQLRLNSSATAPTGAFFELYRADDNGKPTGSRIGNLFWPPTVDVYSGSGVPTWMPDYLTFTTPYTDLDPLLGVVMAVGQTGPTGSLTLGTQTSSSPAPSGYMASTNAGASWTNPSLTRGWYYEAWGTYLFTKPGFDASVSADTAGTASLATAVTVDGANEARMLLAVFTLRNTGADPGDKLINSVTRGGELMERVNESDYGPGGEKVIFYRQTNPAAGTEDAVADFTSTDHAGQVTYISLYDVDQINPEANGGQATGTSATPAVGGYESDRDWCIDGLAWSGAETTAIGGGDRVEMLNVAGSAVSRDEEIPAGQLTTDWSLSGPATWAMAYVTVRSVGAKNPPPAPVKVDASDFYFGRASR
jgi:hypothetical protein